MQNNTCIYNFDKIMYVLKKYKKIKGQIIIHSKTIIQYENENIIQYMRKNDIIV